MIAVRPVIISNGVLYLQMRSLGSHSTSAVEKEGKKERTGQYLISRRNWSVIINLLFYLFFTVVPSNTSVFLSCRPFVVNRTFSTGLVGVDVSSVSWLGQLEFKSLIIVIFGLQNFV